MLRPSDDAKRGKTEQSEEVGAGNDTFRGQAWCSQEEKVCFQRVHLLTRLLGSRAEILSSSQFDVLFVQPRSPPKCCLMFKTPCKETAGEVPSLLPFPSRGLERWCGSVGQIAFGCVFHDFMVRETPGTTRWTKSCGRGVFAWIWWYRVVLGVLARWRGPR